MAVLVFISDSTMACNLDSCAIPCSEDHEFCALHAACAATGIFDPEACTVCAAWITVIRETRPELRSSLPEWTLLKNQFLMAHLMTIQQNKVELRWVSTEIAELFPGIGLVATSPGSSRESSSVDQRTNELRDVMGMLHELQSQITRSSRSRTKRSRSRTRDRSRSRSHRRRRYRRYSSSSSSSSYSDSSSSSERPTSASNPAEGSKAPSVQKPTTPKEPSSLQAQGWIPAPANWQLWERTPGDLKVFCTTVQDGRSVLTEVENIDVTSIETADGPAIFWRGRKTDSKVDTARPFNRIKSMAGGLVGIGTLVKPYAPALSVEMGEIRPNTVTIHSTAPVSTPSCSVEELTKWWKSKAMFSSAPAPSTMKTTAKLNVVWPENSPSNTLGKFLEAKISKGDFPSDFQVKEGETLAADNQTRQRAFQSWQVLSSLELTQDLLESVSMAASQDKNFDSKLIVKLASGVISGVAALMAPLTQTLVEEAVSKRLELLSNSVPEKYKTVKSRLLDAEPLSVKPFGGAESVQAILSTMPQPLEVQLPEQFYKAITDIKTTKNYKQTDNSGKWRGKNNQGYKKQPFRGKYDQNRKDNRNKQKKSGYSGKYDKNRSKDRPKNERDSRESPKKKSSDQTGGDSKSAK